MGGMVTKQQTVVRMGGYEIPVSHPDKLLWPEAGITKLRYLHILAELAPYLLPYTRGRYLTTIRWPEGVGGTSFYQKNCPPNAPAYVHIAQQGDIRYVVLDSPETLLWLGALYCLEFHVSSDEIVMPLLPNAWMLDIDPSRGDEPRLMEAVALVGELLASLGLAAVPKTSGATGVQIVMPIERGPDFETLRSFGKFVSEYLAAKHPRLFTVERLKKDRGDLIYLDYLQHFAGKTLPGAYSPRARPQATVSTPLTWDEVRRDAKPADFTLLNIMDRLHRHGDILAVAPRQQLAPVIAQLQR